MNLDKTLIIVISTLFLTLGCESSVSSSNSEIAPSSTNVQSKRPSNHSQASDTTTQACIMGDGKSINIYYPQNLGELKINGYSTFTLESIDEIETGQGRPHEFTRIYQNDRGYTATLMSQNFIRNLELIDAKGQTTSYSFNFGLECDTLPSTNYSTYIVSADKAFIYKQPDLNSKTSSYFIAGDEIKVTSTKDNWIKTYYLNDSKIGWLRLGDLEVMEGVDSSDRMTLDSNKIITANGTENFTLHTTIEEIESKSGMSLNLKHTINECSMDSSNSDFQLLFLRDTLISVEFFDSSYQTSKGFKVNDNISKLLSTHPEVEYHEYTSNMGDESYYMTNRYYTTRPNAQGNTLTFNVSDRYPDAITDTDPYTITSISVSNNLDDSSICSVY
ncbi:MULTISPECIES: hypothetical protein [unclassified Psychrobacter]|uniref:hypothetical protein n=1 Tax=unclassified Psychrobacter TaxID=196806 RepID=UPI0025B3DF9B|nr:MULTISPECIES: hypothetical protein [unclassified Psychrobacter]MDN3454667.1 hypothetical protein [Psychrobacter sp. APC 3350]MDN3502945.1 hypothetical protein [Psychrobacter sp. 5A.1]